MTFVCIRGQKLKLRSEGGVRMHQLVVLQSSLGSQFDIAVNNVDPRFA